MIDLTKLSDEDLLDKVCYFFSEKESGCHVDIELNEAKSILLERFIHLRHIEALFEDDLEALEKRGYVRCNT